jgi:hypothetical protein
MSVGTSSVGRTLRSLSVALAIGVGALATPALAQFGPQFPIAGAGVPVDNQDIATNANGTAVAVWIRSDGSNIRVQARTRSATGVLGPVLDISDAGQQAVTPQVAVDGTGNAVLAWTRSDGFNTRVQIRTLSAAGILGPVQTLTNAGSDAFTPQVAITAGGDAVITWLRGTVEAVTLSATGVLGPTLTISDLISSSGPQVALDAAGNAMFVWAEFQGGAWRPMTRILTAAGALRQIRLLSQDGQWAQTNPQLAVNDDGNAVFIWLIFDGANTRVEARARSAAGVFGPIRRITPTGRDSYTPHAGIDAAGNAVFTWVRLDASGIDRVQACTLSAANILGPVQTLSPALHHGFNPQIAVDPAGDAVVVWERSNGINERIQARTITTGGALGAVQTISNGTGQNGYEPQVAIDSLGKAVAVWRDAGLIFRVMAAASL